MFTIRKATVNDAQGISNVHVDSWKTTYKGIVSEDFLNNLSVENRIKFWTENLSLGESINLVAVNEGNEVIGFCSGGKEGSNHADYKAELYAIYLLESVQNQGIGKKLLEELINELKIQGYNSLLVWVLKDNSSKQFYEKMGGKQVEETEIEIGGKIYKELSYGWASI